MKGKNKKLNFSSFFFVSFSSSSSSSNLHHLLKAQQRRRRPKHTIDKLDGEFGGARARAPLRLDWACTGVSSYNPNPQKGGGGNVELPICGGVEVIRQSLPNDKRAQSQQQLWEDSSGEHQSKNASQGSGVMGVGGHHPHSHAQNKAGNRKEPNDPFAEAVDFAGKFVVVSVKIVRKMSDNVGLVASVCQKTFKRLFEEKK